jgi:protein-S-isoprenylcysteine O-methyltransferase Ste14
MDGEEDFYFLTALVKIKKEEEFMNEVFGASFQSYKAKVKKLIPGIY